MAHNYKVREGVRKQGTYGGGLHGWGVHRGGTTLVMVLLACAGRRRSRLLLVGEVNGPVLPAAARRVEARLLLLLVEVVGCSQGGRRE